MCHLVSARCFYPLAWLLPTNTPACLINCDLPCRLVKDANSASTEKVRDLQQSAILHPGGIRYRLSGNTLAKPDIQEHLQEPHPNVGVYSRQPQDGPQSIPLSCAECTSYRSTRGCNTPPVMCCNSVRCDCTRHISDGVEDSFSSLSVSNYPSSSSSANTNFATGSAAQSVLVARSCREQAAAACVNSFDDTTVDDLAGYLDEIMFIPKPMSEMAELMYT